MCRGVCMWRALHYSFDSYPNVSRLPRSVVQMAAQYEEEAEPGEATKRERLRECVLNRRRSRMYKKELKGMSGLMVVWEGQGKRQVRLAC